MIFKEVTIRINWNNITDFKPATKITNVYYTLYAANSYFSESYRMPKEPERQQVEFVENITVSNQKYLWELTSSVEYENSWAIVTSSDWFNTTITSSGYYVTGSTPNVKGLNFPVMVSGSFEPGTVTSHWRSIPPTSGSYFYVSSSNAYNQLTQYTSSLFYELQSAMR